jgi:hypothetical protein
LSKNAIPLIIPYNPSLKEIPLSQLIPVKLIVELNNLETRTMITYSNPPSLHSKYFAKTGPLALRFDGEIPQKSMP